MRKKDIKIKPRTFVSLTDKELEFICYSILGVKNISSIDKIFDTFEISVVNICKMLNGEEFEVNDIITLSVEGISASDYDFSSEEIDRYFKYLAALGINQYFVDNEFLGKV